MAHVFDVPAYFILLRETLEVTIILAVLLGFVDNLALGNDSLRMKFKRQIWIGTAAGLVVSLLIGAIFIIVFYVVKKNLWEDSEAAWEGAFSLIASVVITIMSLSMVQAQKWKSKWENKLKGATEQYLKKHEEGNRWALILLPFSVVLREGVETIVFMAGIGFQNPATGLPIPIITGLLSGVFVGYIIYKGSHKLSLKLFFGFTTTLLLFIAAGLFSNSIHELQDVTGTYEQVVWELKCCNKGQFWSLMKNLFGWRNKATVGTTVGYFVYWIVIGLAILYLTYKEKKRTLVLKGEIIDKEDGEKDIEKGEKDVEKDVEIGEKDVEKDVEKDDETVVVEKEVEKVVVEKDDENVVVEKEVENVVVEKDDEKVVVEKEVETVVVEKDDEKVVVEKEVETVVVEKDDEKVVVEKEVETVVVEKDDEKVVVEKEVETVVVEKDVETVVVEKDDEKVVVEKDDEKVVEKDVEKAVEKDEKVVEKDEKDIEKEEKDESKV